MYFLQGYSGGDFGQVVSEGGGWFAKGQRLTRDGVEVRDQRCPGTNNPESLWTISKEYSAKAKKIQRKIESETAGATRKKLLTTMVEDVRPLLGRLQKHGDEDCRKKTSKEAAAGVLNQLDALFLDIDGAMLIAPPTEVTSESAKEAERRIAAEQKDREAREAQVVYAASQDKEAPSITPTEAVVGKPFPVIPVVIGIGVLAVIGVIVAVLKK